MLRVGERHGQRRGSEDFGGGPCRVEGAFVFLLLRGSLPGGLLTERHKGGLVLMREFVLPAREGLVALPLELRAKVGEPRVPLVLELRAQGRDGGLTLALGLGAKVGERGASLPFELGAKVGERRLVIGGGTGDRRLDRLVAVG